MRMPQGVHEIFERLQQCVRDDDWDEFGSIFAEIDRRGPLGEGDDIEETEANRSLVRRYFEMWNTGAGVVADAVLGPRYLDHAHPGTLGPAAARSLAPRFHAANPDALMIIEQMVVDGDFVAVRNSIRRQGSEEVVLRGLAFFRVAEGKLAEQWSFYPSRGLFKMKGKR